MKMSKELEKDLRTIGQLGYCHFDFKKFKQNIKMLEQFMESKEAKEMFKIIKNEYNIAKRNIEKYNRMMEEGINPEKGRQLQ